MDIVHAVDFLAFDGFNLLDLSGPLAAFETATKYLTGVRYEWRLLSAAGGHVMSSTGIPVGTAAARGAQGRTLIVPGGEGVCRAEEDPRLIALIRGPSRYERVASVCTGAFLLARAGLLDKRRATTHWRRAHELQRRYPKTRVDADRIVVQDGHVWTSAGASAGMDLALGLIEGDGGTDVARQVARELVVYHRRAGGQLQFSRLPDVVPPSARIRAALDHIRTHLQRPLSIDDLAEVAHLSPRQFTRAFIAQTGLTPAKMVERLRIEAARPLVEESTQSLEDIARLTGFGDPERMRRAFIRYFGQPPQAVRRDGVHAGRVVLRVEDAGRPRSEEE